MVIKSVENLLILDFGSQFTQLIARRVREYGVYCEIAPATIPLDEIKSKNPRALILSGGPHSVFDKGSPQCDGRVLDLGIPVLGICYGMQWLGQALQGKVEAAKNREYGFMEVEVCDPESALFAKLAKKKFRSWMSHGDEVVALPQGFSLVAKSQSGGMAAMENRSRNIFAVQFHPEVTHTEFGKEIIHGFLGKISWQEKWNLGAFAKLKEGEISDHVGEHEHAICALSGGVDSTVAATMVQKALGERLHCFYIDSGLQRENERDSVMASFSGSGLKVTCVDARAEFLGALAGVIDPEQKRKHIGRIFIEIFERESKILAKALGKDSIKYLVQGTLYPDVIESLPPPGRGGFSATIKSHHNVGGLPERMHLQLLEPLRELFKDEVRAIGRELGVSPAILGRHPFPGPGLAVRCLGEVKEERLKILRAADKIFIDEMRSFGLYDQVWQAGAILLNVSSVGVMGDGRTYESTIALRAVTSEDGMTADWVKFPHEFLAKVSSRIVNEVRGVNRVVYDISTKPPSTIEWE